MKSNTMNQMIKEEMEIMNPEYNFLFHNRKFLVKALIFTNFSISS